MSISASAGSRVSYVLLSVSLALALTASLVSAEAPLGSAEAALKSRLHHPQRPALSAEEALERKRDAFLFGTAYTDNGEHHRPPPPLPPSPPPSLQAATADTNNDSKSKRKLPPRSGLSNNAKPESQERVKENTSSSAADTARKVGNGIAASSSNAASFLSNLLHFFPAAFNIITLMLSYAFSALFSVVSWPIQHIIWPPLAVMLAPVLMTLTYVYNFWVATPLTWIFNLSRILYPMYLFLGAAVIVGLSLGFFATGGVVVSNAIIPLRSDSTSKEEDELQTSGSASRDTIGGTTTPKRKQSVLDKAIAQKEREWKQQQQQQELQQQLQQNEQQSHSAQRTSRDLPPAVTSPKQARISLREESRSLSPIALARRSQHASSAVQAAPTSALGTNLPPATSYAQHHHQQQQQHHYYMGAGPSSGHGLSTMRSPVEERDRMLFNNTKSAPFSAGPFTSPSPSVSPVSYTSQLPPLSSSSINTTSLHHRKRMVQQQQSLRSNVSSTA
ncbi:hypothetical protein A4X09_0g7223 [Tilletia walkeri]|uniref:Uncharacterized protein n=1 Tax=Tilletia walkeri TaxID=117179 RepID=A0A8X7N3N0_9BASI|nr:hypothetical protein A4X09_0g7223 [Tilletia walkeri]